MKFLLYVFLILALVSCGKRVVTLQGTPGLNGINGQNASPCTVESVSGGSLVTCPDGSKSIISNGSDGPIGQVGPQGPIGFTGNPGTAGTNGKDGTDATPVTAVKFCPGYTTTYPSTFPEYGLCIGGKLYANYWDGHNSWLAEVVPGNYSSTSTSAPCNFIVTANCTVTN